MINFSKKYQNQIFPKSWKLTFLITNFTKFYWSAFNTNPNNPKYTLEPLNTEIFKVFSIFDSTKWNSLVLTTDNEIYRLILGICNFCDIFCSWQLENYYTYFGANGGEKLYWICRCRDESFSFEVSVLLNNGGFTFWSLVNRVP